MYFFFFITLDELNHRALLNSVRTVNTGEYTKEQRKQVRLLTQTVTVSICRGKWEHEDITWMEQTPNAEADRQFSRELENTQ